MIVRASDDSVLVAECTASLTNVCAVEIAWLTLRLVSTLVDVVAPVFTPTKFSLGYIYDFHVAEHVKLGIGGLASRYIVPKGLDLAYGSDPTSFMTFIRLKIY